MTSKEGQKLVLVGAVGTLGIETLRVALQDQTWDTRLFVGGGIAFTVLAGVSEVAPTFAGMFAMVVLTTVMLADGATVMNQLLSVGNSQSPTKHRKTK